ncbi:MAG: choice-of-anchor P family protein [Nocardioidaceae bacterium]
MIALGDRDRTVKGNGAQANADALRIKIIPTQTVVFLAHSRAQIQSGLRQGIYSGSSYATRANVLNGAVTSGPTPLLIMPCVGTKFERADVARVNLGGLAIARGLNASQRGVVRNGNPTAFERGKVARANLLNGTIVVRGVVGKANVTLDGNQARKNTKGTTIAEVRFSGRLINLAGRDSIKLGNVARIEPRVVKRTKFGIEVTALRVTLLRRERCHQSRAREGGDSA